ncbi:DNA-processing protein DprA [Sneathiella aquimaris]|uniref:DNA-processing protein DprA n=1 Tax=Sneathiella aquimaris TaxID=2599305 RepID=UPI00146BA9F2|nr:DNA-processing protein DprA [Sneathiella aquimaris]
MQHNIELSFAERLNWLRLIRSENVGPITFFQLLNRFENAGRALEAIPELARNGGRKKPIRIYAKGAAEREMEQVIQYGGQLIGSCEPNYPPLLRHIPDAPPVISLKGHTDLLGKNMLGVVGSRNASAVAQNLTRSLCSKLGNNGLVIASGLARGIDKVAHEASLTTGTVAVVGGGLDVKYPRENADLQAQIENGGCVIAEQPFGTQPQARHFPRRNRIISGMALGILVMEATPKSGSLITARMAAEQGRDVFAVPGSPMDPRAKGTNNLIKNGAILVESDQDILQELSGLKSLPLSEPEQPALPFDRTLSPNEQTLDQARPVLLHLLSPTPIDIDELVRLTEFPPGVVLTILLELELAGRIERHFGNRVSFAS